jgi:hypothetical protein
LVTTSCIAGILVEPPTRTTSSILLLSSFASFNAFSTGILALSINEEHNSSNLFRVIDLSKCFGPVSVAVKKGRLMSVCVKFDNSTFAFSAASVSLCNA